MRRISALVAACLVLVACGGGTERSPDRAQPATTTTTASDRTGPPEPGAPALEWEPCGDAECATVEVPVDHADPDGPTIGIAVLRLPATGDRIGSLFVNFGGPGSGAVEVAPRFRWPDEVREHFDVVAVDPRGVGGSEPLACGVPAPELYAVDHTVEDDTDRAALIEVSEAYARDCADRRGELLPHVGTWDVARDLDVVRAALGDERLSYLGYSYGTAVGQAYAELFPDRVRAMVLDGVVDPSADGIGTAVQQAEGFEVALERWAERCGDRPSCPADDPVRAVDRALAAAEEGVPAGDRELGPGQAVIGLAMALYAESLWSLLDAAVEGVLAGDGSTLLGLADQYVTLVDFAAYFAVSCLDSEWPASPEEHFAAAEAAAARSPRFGEALVNDYLRCTVWPTEPVPFGPVTAAGSAPILLVSTTGDPATPHASAVAVAERLASAVLLTREGDGHTVVFRGDGCIDDAVLSYLVALEPPPTGTRC